MSDPISLPYAQPDTLESSIGPQRRLSLVDAVGIIVGVIIGAGIFETAGSVAGAAGSATITILLWAAGGLISLLGALCYAELATTYPKQGGEYVFLTRAFGPRIGFLFAWTGFWIVRPGNIGAMAYVFGHYCDQLTASSHFDQQAQQWVRSHAANPTVWAGGAVAVLTLLNVIGLRAGTRAQNILTAVKLLGIGLVIFVGMSTAGSRAENGEFFFQRRHDYRLAMIYILFTYGGWNEIAYVAAEVRNPTRNLSRSLVLGVLVVTAIYLLFTAAVLPGLRFEHQTPSEWMWMSSIVWASDSMSSWWVGTLIILVCVSSLGAIQAMIFAGSRIFYAVGTEHSAYRWLGRWDDRGGGTPIRSLLVQGALTLSLMFAFRDFDALVNFTTPVFWFFFLLAALSLFVLRARDEQTPRPYRVPLYPLTPILFAGSCLFMLHASLTYAWDNRRIEAVWSILLLLAGVIASIWAGGRALPR